MGLQSLIPSTGGGGGGSANLAASLSATQVVITSDAGTDATIPAADTTNAGVMTKAMFDKLAGIVSGAGAVTIDGISLATTANLTAAVTGLLDFKGSTDASANPNYAAASKGDCYMISVAGKIGGASGKTVSVGDLVFAIADNAGGTEASVGTSWDVLEGNIPGITAAGLSMIQAANAAAQAALLPSLVGDSGSGGTKGLVPAPAAGDAAAGKFLKADGTFAVPGGGSISTPKVAYVETSGNNATGALGNPALPFETATAAYNAGVTSAVEFVLDLGVGTHSLELAADMNGLLKAVTGCGPLATVLNISGTPPTVVNAIAGYSTTCNYSNLTLDLNLPGGTSNGTSGESGGSATLQTLTGTNCKLSVTLIGGNADSVSGGVGGSGGTLRCSGDFTITNTDLAEGTGAGGSGSAGSFELDGCNLSTCSYSQAPSAATFYRCTYQLSAITPSTALACAGF